MYTTALTIFSAIVLSVKATESMTQEDIDLEAFALVDDNEAFEEGGDDDLGDHYFAETFDENNEDDKEFM